LQNKAKKTRFFCKVQLKLLFFLSGKFATYNCAISNSNVRQNHNQPKQQETVEVAISETMIDSNVKDIDD